MNIGNEVSRELIANNLKSGMRQMAQTALWATRLMPYEIYDKTKNFLHLFNRIENDLADTSAINDRLRNAERKMK